MYLTEADHKVPSCAINPSPPAVRYHRIPVSASFSSLLLFIATTQRMAWIDGSMHMQRLTVAQMFPFFPFSQQHAATTDGEFVRHETWRVRLTNWGMGINEKAAKPNSVWLSSTPSVSTVQLRWKSVHSGSRLRWGETCVSGAYRWGMGRAAFRRACA